MTQTGPELQRGDRPGDVCKHPGARHGRRGPRQMLQTLRVGGLIPDSNTDLKLPSCGHLRN